MTQWCSQYENAEYGCRVGYRAVGSGAGLRLATDRAVDFGCSDAPLSDEKLARAKSLGVDIVHIPLVLGAVVPVYNLEGFSVPLQFDGAALAGIYLGKIKKWNDAALVALNPGVILPDRAIVVIHRSDGSGTTYIWADYLSKVSAEWHKAVGKDTELKWPVGVAAAGNEGVAERVQKTPGGIGYVELIFAFRFDLPHGLVQNREKEFVKASLPSIRTAADNAVVDIPDDLRFSLTVAPGKGSYPIVGATWAVVPTPPRAKKGRPLVHFLEWILNEGQGGTETLLYARLPDTLLEKARRKLVAIRSDPE